LSLTALAIEASIFGTDAVRGIGTKTCSAGQVSPVFESTMMPSRPTGSL
jgi:hypothetical protein